MNGVLHIDGLTFALRRSPRRKTLGLTVDRGGELVVHAPDAMAQDQIAQWVGTRLLWVHRKLAQKEALRQERRPLEFVSGESICYLGRGYRLRVVDGQPEPLEFDGEWFNLRRSDQPSAAGHFRDWFIRAGTDWLQERVKRLSPKTGGGPVAIAVGDLGFRWGSCGKDGVLHLNWRLLQLPVHLIDYVVAHELVHRVERHHTQPFWQAFERAMPDCREREAELAREWHVYASFEVHSQPCCAEGGPGRCRQVTGRAGL